MFPEVAVVQLGTQNTLMVWATDGSVFSSNTADFTPVQATGTDCEAYGYCGGSGSGSGSFGPALALPKHLSKWSTMSPTWRFVLADVADGNGDNCDALNGTWALRFDSHHPERCRWFVPVPRGLFGGQATAVWRLQYEPADGYWYLDYASNLDQAPGSWISYRRHDSAWDPHGSNELHLLTDSGLCDVPPKVTLTPV
jgi:hypothetical protein